MPNLMFEHLAILEILTFNAQKWGHVTLTTPPFANFFQGSCRDFNTWDHACQILEVPPDPLSGIVAAGFWGSDTLPIAQPTE